MNRMSITLKKALILMRLIWAAVGSLVWAEATPNSLFCEGMVLQRDAEVPVWD